VKSALVCAVFAALLLAFAAFAGVARGTTAPGGRYVVGVRITDQSVNVFEGARAPRGAIITFLVANAGKKLHAFSLLGKRTPLIAPKHSARFTVILLARGKFLYRSPVDTGPRFRGYFLVY
jgi:hypothetical protein